MSPCVLKLPWNRHRNAPLPSHSGAEKRIRSQHSHPGQEASRVGMQQRTLTEMPKSYMPPGGPHPSPTVSVYGQLSPSIQTSYHICAVQPHSHTAAHLRECVEPLGLRSP